MSLDERQGQPAGDVSVAHSERLALRELVPEDAAFILELVNDPAWLRFIGDRNVHSLEDARGYIARIRDGSYAKHGFGLWAVVPREGGDPVGMCGLIRREALEHVDLGFALLERHRGKGYAREAAALSVELARDRFGLAKLVAIADRDNVGSHRVLEAVGFRHEQDIHWGETGETLSLFGLDLAP